MISFNFEYYEPAAWQEAVSLFQQLETQGKRPMYFSGGTEIITLGRINRVYTEAVIDLKGIPECRTLAVQDGKLILGSALSLSEVVDSRVFPLLGNTAAGVADRTSRNKITLGGNICGQFIYKEAVLPFLLTDSEVMLAGPSGLRQVPIMPLFDRTLRLEKGEFLVQTLTDAGYASLPYVTRKKRKVSAIDYPLITLAALRTGSGIRAAFSGLCAFPFRSAAVDEALNRRELPLENRIRQASVNLPAPILSDIKASAPYRELILKNLLQEAMTALGAV